MQQLRKVGFYDGDELGTGGEMDSRLARAVAPGVTDERRRELFREWHTQVQRACCAMAPGYPTLWLEEPDDEVVGHVHAYFGNRLREFSGTDYDASLHAFRMLPSVFGIIYHVACMGNWKNVVIEQLDLIRDSGLNGLNVSILGSVEDRRWFENTAAERNIEATVRFESSNLLLFEIPAIRMVEDWAKSHGEGYLLYFHTKGVSSPWSPVKRKWRQLMGERVISGWKKNCEHLLDGFDAVGVNWKDVPPVSHFPGNFFIATASFLRSLEDFSHYYLNPRHVRDENYYRIAAELWVGSGDRTPRVVSLVSKGEAIESPCYWRKYRDLVVEGERTLVLGSGDIHLREVECGHGTMSAGGKLGYEGHDIINSNGFEETVSAHADSEIELSLERPYWIAGFLNGSAGPCNGVRFSIDSEVLGSVCIPHEVTRSKLLFPGKYRLKAKGVDGTSWCHSVWGLYGKNRHPKELKYGMVVALLGSSNQPIHRFEDWLNHHLALGVDHFVLPSEMREIESYASVIFREGLRERISYLGEDYCEPSNWLRLIHEHFTGLAKWIAAIDANDFLIPKIGRNLPRFMSAFDEFGALEVGKRRVMDWRDENRIHSPSGGLSNRVGIDGSCFIFQPRFVAGFDSAGRPETMSGRSLICEHFGEDVTTMHILVAKAEGIEDVSYVLDFSSKARSEELETGSQRNSQIDRGSSTSDVVGFIHVATVNNWRAIFGAQFQKIEKSGLLDVSEAIYIGVVGGSVTEAKEIEDMHPKLSVEAICPNLGEFEFPTLEVMHRHCQSNSGAVWYIHTKGVVNPRQEQQSWRNRMEEFVVIHHDIAREKLRAGYRVAAGFGDSNTNWVVPGNFWWARADHIASLPKIEELDRSNRWEAERWISMSGVSNFYWLDSGDTIFSDFRILEATVAAGMLSTNGFHGWMRSQVTTGREWLWDRLLSAHAPSRIVLDVTNQIGVFGFMSGTSEPRDWAVEFRINGRSFGRCGESLERTPLQVLPEGRYVLEAAIVGGVLWGAHSCWAITTDERHVGEE